MSCSQPDANRRDAVLSQRAPLNILFAASNESWLQYAPLLQTAFARYQLNVNLQCSLQADSVDYIVYAPDSAVQDFRPFTRCKAVLSLWAGVDTIVDNPTLTQPLCRMVDSGLREGMREYVLAHVLRHHLELDRYIKRHDSAWEPHLAPLARHRRVCVLGMGELGLDCAKALRHIGFEVSGWSRTARDVEGVQCLSGLASLPAALAQAEILVLLLPLTPDTRYLINAERLAQCPAGVVLINPGRGALVEEQALLQALDSGHVKHATLDTFEVEPLSSDHPFNHHSQITVTPHIASTTRADTAALVLAENVRRSEEGEPLQYRVDRLRGY